MKKFLLLLLLSSLGLFAAEFHVDMSKKENLVKFTSQMPIESFDGKTQKINGYFKYNGNDLKGAEMYFEVDLNSITTGIGLRDQHMRDNYLETKKYPKTTFKGNVSSVTENNGTYTVTVDGSMSIHGVTKQVQIKGTIAMVNGGCKVKTKFFVKLSDYKIEIPSIMFTKLNENIELNLDFFMKKVK